MASTPIVEKPPKVRVPRRSARQRVETLMYLDLGSENGGFPINISEDGMSFQGIRPLQVGQEIFIAFKLDGSNESITTKAKIVWLTETRKAGALRYVDMPEDFRSRVTEWIALQKEDEASQQDAVAEPSEVKKNLTPVASVPASALNPAPSPARAMEALVSPPAVSLPAAATESRPKVAPSARPENRSNLPSQPPSRAPKSQQTGRFLVVGEPKTKRSRGFKSLEVGLAAFGAIAIISGALLWPSHEALLQRLHGNREGSTDHPAATVRMAAPPAADAPMAEIPSDLPMKDPAQLSLAANLPPAQASPASPDTHIIARQDRPQQPSKPTSRPAPVSRSEKHETAEAGPFFSLRAMRPRNPVVTTAQNRAPAGALPDAPLQNASELPGAGNTPGKMLLLESKAPASPVTTTGSVEIISDPYPSIRMPANSGGPAARLGASLQIGRLASKVDPVYPPEALRQRTGGKVRLHVVIDRMGAVESASIIDGPAPLADAALRAVRQWRYEATTVGGAAVEVEQDVTVVFRVTSSSSPAN